MRNIFRHLFISVALTVSAMSYCNAANNDLTEQQDTVLHHDTTVVITETDSLKLYKPIFYGGIGLCCDCCENPPMGDNPVFVAAAAYTKSYNWTKFNLEKLGEVDAIDFELYTSRTDIPTSFCLDELNVYVNITY